MISEFKKIKEQANVQFSMPLSLRIIKTLGEMQYYKLHFADVLSLYYSCKIDLAKQYLTQRRQEKMQKRGISSINQANIDDFNAL